LTVIDPRQQAIAWLVVCAYALAVPAGGSAHCADWLEEAWIEVIGPEKLLELYGGTEAQAATTISGTEWLTHRGSVGKPLVGEMIVLDAEGHTDLILSGGANIYPAEVEAALDTHPRVVCSVVVGIPDADLGQRVHALVQASGDLHRASVTLAAEARSRWRRGPVLVSVGFRREM
jgi:bile acid-coenzyme A ligase